MTTEELTQLGAEMNEQDNRGTRAVIFVVQQRRKRYCDRNDAEEHERKDIDSIDEADLCEKCSEQYADEYTIPEECDNCSEDTFDFFSWEWEFAFNTGAAFFFTSKECDRHIEANRHHYGKSARSYGLSAWNNDELCNMMAHLSALATEDGKPTSTYRV